MKVIFETERLAARLWDVDGDVAAAFKIYGDPRVTAFISSGAVDADLEAVRHRLQRYASLGEGSLALIEKATGELVGNVFLTYLPDAERKPTGDWQVGWHLRSDRWGCGYATEAGRTALERGFTVLQLPVLYAVVDPGNLASQRVARRLGMRAIGLTRLYYGLELVQFELLQAEFHRHSQPAPERASGK